ncbi:MAG: peptidylprolyl isomerase [Candidatus Diapherotrites archaeon]|nr:peptidylprolyl isomerase [Candidatus Diapherotrites archaeon]
MQNTKKAGSPKKVEKGSYVEIEYELYAENEEITKQNAKIIAGNNEIIAGIDEALEGMEEGNEKKLLLKPEKAFGLRSNELIRIIPIKNFHEQKINPFPGLIIDANGLKGKVISVSGGRVKVDFNHPLANKEIEAKIKVKKIFSNKEAVEEICKEILSNEILKEFKLNWNVKLNNGNVKVEIELPPTIDIEKWNSFWKEIKKIIEERIRALKGIEKIEISAEIKKG